MAQYISRRALKRRAKEQLHEGTVYRDMVVANLVPGLITAVASLIGVWLTFEAVTQFGVGNIAANPANFADTFTGQDQSTNRQLMVSLIGLWFSQGLAFTALDITRGEIQGFPPMQALFRNFTGRYFFGLFSLWLLTGVLTGLGVLLLIVPGILLTYGLSMAYYAYYDGRKTGAPYSVFTAMGDSWRLMRGNKFDLFVLDLSLIGWTLLKMITLHLFDFLIDPYLQLVRAGFYVNVRALAEEEY